MNGGKVKIATILKITIEIGTVLIARMALLFSIRPQLLPWNNNHFERANAGDVESQMFLADHYFEIGDYKEAIYWYKLASVIKGEYQAKARNNLGYIYAMGWGLITLMLYPKSPPVFIVRLLSPNMFPLTHTQGASSGMGKRNILTVVVMLLDLLLPIRIMRKPFRRI